MAKVNFSRNNLKRAYVSAKSSGYIASGDVVLVYESNNGDDDDIHYSVPYDTKGTPDGLSAMIDVSVDDVVRDDETREKLLVTEFVREYASKTLSQYAEAVRQGGSSRGSVVFRKTVGINDEWLPE